jgi:hypothetical protein
MQSKKFSRIEALTNVVAGFLTSMLIQALVYPLFGIKTSLSTDFYITIIFLVVSYIRSYLFRRLFNSFKEENN